MSDFQISELLRSYQNQGANYQNQAANPDFYQINQSQEVASANFVEGVSRSLAVAIESVNAAADRLQRVRDRAHGDAKTVGNGAPQTTPRPVRAGAMGEVKDKLDNLKAAIDDLTSIIPALDEIV